MLGSLSGISMLHLIVLASIPDEADFIDFYAKFARNVNFIFLLLCNLALILHMAMSFIYMKTADKKIFHLDNERGAHRSQYIEAIAITVILFVSLICLYILPYFTIQIHYKDPADIESGVAN